MSWMLVAWLLQLQSVDKVLALDLVNKSARVAELNADASERLSPKERVVPGQPPLLAFRLLEGKDRHKYGDLDLVLDDAGH